MQYLIEAVSFFSALLLVVAVGLPALGWHLLIPSLQLAVLLPVLLLLTNFVRIVWGLREATGCKLAQASGAFLFFFALSWVTCRACLAACLHKKGVFLRTPKVRESQKWRQAVHITVQETLLSLLFVAVAILTLVHDQARVLPAGLLTLQGVIYGMAPLCALAVSGIWLLPSWLLGTKQPRTARPQQSTEPQPEYALRHWQASAQREIWKRGTPPMRRSVHASQRWPGVLASQARSAGTFLADTASETEPHSAYAEWHTPWPPLPPSPWRDHSLHRQPNTEPLFENLAFPCSGNRFPGKTVTIPTPFTQELVLPLVGRP